MNQYIQLKNILIFLVFTCISTYSYSVPFDKLVERRGVLYEINSTIPYTGSFESFHENGQLSFQGQTVKGIHHGKYMSFYDNGEVLSEGNSLNGESHGVWKGFYLDGSFHWEENYEKGMIIYKKSVTEEGDILEDLSFKNGKKSGVENTYRYLPHYYLSETSKYKNDELLSSSSTDSNKNVTKDLIFENGKKTGFEYYHGTWGDDLYTKISEYMDDELLSEKEILKNSGILFWERIFKDGQIYQINDYDKLTGKITYEMNRGEFHPEKIRISKRFFNDGSFEVTCDKKQPEGSRLNWEKVDCPEPNKEYLGVPIIISRYLIKGSSELQKGKYRIYCTNDLGTEKIICPQPR